MMDKVVIKMIPKKMKKNFLSELVNSKEKLEGNTK